jgi:hypothetical protein
MSPDTWERIVHEVHPDLEASLEPIQGTNDLHYVATYRHPLGDVVLGGRLVIDAWLLRHSKAPEEVARREVARAFESLFP